MKFKIIPNEQTSKCIDIVNLETDKKLLEKFLSFSMRQYNCAGLAANQVSLDNNRIMKSFFTICFNHHWDIIINPEIIEYIGESEQKIEGCLTWLGKKIIAERYSEIHVSYYNIKGLKIVATIIGYEAQIWQHEYNHLMGIEEKFLEEN